MPEIELTRKQLWYRQYHSNPENRAKEAAYGKRYRDTHKEQTAARHKKWHEENKPQIEERRKARNFLKKYGISKQNFHDMEIRQGGKCFICGSTNGPGVNLCVDHDHKTGKVRSLLCHCCNLAIGNLKENVNTTWKILDYLCDSQPKQEVR